MKDVSREIEEVIARIDEFTSGKGLRAAQRRALCQCRSRLEAMSRKLVNSSGQGRVELVAAVLAVMERTCELVNAYFCRRRER